MAEFSGLTRFHLFYILSRKMQWLLGLLPIMSGIESLSPKPFGKLFLLAFASTCVLLKSPGLIYLV